MLHRLFRMQSSATVSSLTGKKSHHPDIGASLESQWWRNPPANAGDLGLISWSGRAPGEGSGDPLQDSCLGNPTGMELCRLQSTGSQRVRHNLVLIEHARTRTVLDHFLERVNIIESNKEPEHAPSVSCGWNCSLSFLSYWWWSFTSTIPTCSPSSSHYLFLLVHMTSAPVYQLLYCTIVLFKVPYYNIKNISFIFLCMFFYGLFLWKVYKPIII